MHDLGGCVKEDCEPLGLLSDISGGGTTPKNFSRELSAARGAARSARFALNHISELLV
jgi:hypothetical protein